MKKRVKIMLIGVMAGLSLGCWPAAGDLEVSAGVTIHSPSEFYQPLSGLGAWVDIGHFGHCWHPTHLAVGWRPYCVGQWQWTNCGWYWQSAEPWAWACYHYGSWMLDPNYGWVWVPGTEWAPSWVTWRESDDYIGWAPYGPPGFVVAPSAFVFVGAARFCDPIQRSTVVVNDTRIIERTRVVSNMSRETRTIDGASRRVIVNNGPRMDLVQRATRRNLQPVPVREVAQLTPMPKTLAPTGSEKQRVFQEPTQKQPTREKPPVVQERPQPPKDSRVVPAPNQSKTPARESPTGRQPQRVYPREPSQPPTTQHPSAPPTQPVRPPGSTTERDDKRVHPNPPPAQHVVPNPPRPVQPPSGPTPAQQQRERDQQRDGL